MKSMNSAVSGLKAMQTAMDVIGNNIANVNTSGFKASRTDFSDLFYQTLEGGTESVNPSEVGYGAKVQSVVKDMTNAGATTTDRALDLYIDGNGYFTVNTTADPANGTKYYTRVGSMQIDSEGYLADENGNYVMGLDGANATGLNTIRIVGDGTEGSGAWFVPTDGSGSENISSAGVFKDVTNMTINADGTITAQFNGKTGTLHYAGDSEGNQIVIGLASFANQDGLSENGSNYFVSTVSSGNAQYMQAGDGNTTVLRTGALEESNVDLAKEFTTMITTQRGFQANSRVITVSDSLLEEIVNLKRS